MKIIYEDTEKLIVEKPAGVLTQSARSFDTDLVSEVLTYRRSKKETAYAAVINRLDRPVGGLVLFAKTKQAAARLSKEMQQNTLNKQYYALICGKPEQSKGTFVDYLQKDAAPTRFSVQTLSYSEYLTDTTSQIFPDEFLHHCLPVLRGQLQRPRVTAGYRHHVISGHRHAAEKMNTRQIPALNRLLPVLPKM